MKDDLNTKIEILEIDEECNHGKFAMSPLERGYGTTIGNSLRRVLLSSLPGSAVANIKIDGVLHEFTTVPGVVEDVPEIILNIKGIALKKLSPDPVTLVLDVEGPKIVTAGDINPDSEIEIANPDHHIATINETGRLRIEMLVIDGKGYIMAEQNKNESETIGVIPIDSSFTPVEKVNYFVENTRVGQITDYDKLILEVWTDGTMTPQEATSMGADILMSYLGLFKDLPNYEYQEVVEEVKADVNQDKTLSISIEDLDLSLRSFNCLKRAGINTVEDIISKSVEELWKIKNFGKKSFSEVEEKIISLGLSFKEFNEDESNN